MRRFVKGQTKGLDLIGGLVFLLRVIKLCSLSGRARNIESLWPDIAFAPHCRANANCGGWKHRASPALNPKRYESARIGLPRRAIQKIAKYQPCLTVKTAFFLPIFTRFFYFVLPHFCIAVFAVFSLTPYFPGIFSSYLHPFPFNYPPQKNTHARAHNYNKSLPFLFPNSAHIHA